MEDGGSNKLFRIEWLQVNPELLENLQQTDKTCPHGLSYKLVEKKNNTNSLKSSVESVFVWEKSEGRKTVF